MMACSTRQCVGQAHEQLRVAHHRPTVPAATRLRRSRRSYKTITYISLNQSATHSLKTETPFPNVVSKLCGLGAAVLVFMTPACTAEANERVAEFATSGFIPVPGIFRDTVQVIRLEDPGVEGVTLYYTDYSRSIQEKLASDPFADPSQSSVTCVATGPVVVKDREAASSGDGVEIFNELKTFNLLQNKRLRVRRIYDEPNGAVIYVSYSTRFTSTSDEGGVSSSRYRTSICALPVAKN